MIVIGIIETKPGRQPAIVASDFNKGGTWSGAVEELKRPNAKPVFVRMGTSVPKGNSALIELGAQELSPQFIKGTVNDLLNGQESLLSAKKSQTPVSYENIELFETDVPTLVREKSPDE